MLVVENASFGYGSMEVCRGIHLTVEPGEVVCLLGRNGMGKTTLLEGIMGLNRLMGGRILFKGEDISRTPAHRRARMGMALVPQGRRIFPHVSVRDNLRLGALSRVQQKGAVPQVIFEYFPRLRERLDQKGHTLSGGEQQMLAMARALAAEPDVLLLDEPSEGLAPLIVDLMKEMVIRLRDRGLGILLAEQNLPFALATATRAYILEKGRIVDSGDVASLQNRTAIREYLIV